MLREAAEALLQVHKLGFIHRDIAPRKILCDADGNVQLADFGLVKYVELRKMLIPQFSTITRMDALQKAINMQLPGGHHNALGVRTRMRMVYSLGTMMSMPLV
jgi:serine/threonine protein kinase